MLNKRRVPERALSLLLTFVLLNVYVLSNARTSTASTTTAETTSSSLLVGYLSVAGEQSVLVNGNEAGAGTTIVSGVRLQTPAGVNAAVQLDSLGVVTIAPNTDMLLSFSHGRVEANVTSGDATLTTRDGVNATMKTADGSVVRSEGAKAATLTSKKGGVRSSAALSNGQKAALIIIPIVVVIVIVAAVVANGDDDSPRNP